MPSGFEEYGGQGGVPGPGTGNWWTIDPGPTVGELWEEPSGLADGRLRFRGIFGGGDDWAWCELHRSWTAANYKWWAACRYKSTIGETENLLAVTAKIAPAGTVDVDLSASPGELASTDDAGWYAGAHLCVIGGEIISYRTATLIGENRYRLTGLYRAWCDTEIEAHGAASTFYLLSEYQPWYDVPDYELDSIFNLKVLSFNRGGVAQPGGLGAIAAVPISVTGRGIHRQFQPGVGAMFEAGEDLGHGDYVYLKCADMRAYKAVTTDTPRLGFVQSPFYPGGGVSAGEKVYVQFDGIFELAPDATPTWDECEYLYLTGADAGEVSNVDDGEHAVALAIGDQRVPPYNIEIFPARPCNGLEVCDAAGLRLTIPGIAGVAATAARCDQTHRSKVHVAAAFPGVALEDGDVMYRTDWDLFLDRSDGAWMPHAEALFRAHKTFHANMEGTAYAGNAVAVDRDLVRLNAGDNKPCFTEAPAWVEQATRIEQDNSPNIYGYARQAVTGNVVFRQDSGVALGDDANCQVLRNGVVDGAWNQPVNLEYTMANVPPGVHKFELDGRGAVTEFTYFWRLRLQQYPYQGLGGEDDEAAVLALLEPWITSIGIGRTDTGGDPAKNTYGEGVIHRLPMGDGLTDQTPTRGDLNWGGWTPWAAATADTQPLPTWAKASLETVVAGAVPGYPPIQPGGTFMLDAIAGTRGRRFAADTPYYHLRTPELAASRIFMLVVPMLVRVTALGAGSQFEVGEPCLAIATIMATGLATSLNMFINYNVNTHAVDLFKLEAM